MATLMEKDVLIELVASAQTCLALRIESKSPASDDEQYLGKMYRDILSSHPDELDFFALVDEIKGIKKRYESQPVLERYV